MIRINPRADGTYVVETKYSAVPYETRDGAFAAAAVLLDQQQEAAGVFDPVTKLAEAMSATNNAVDALRKGCEALTEHQDRTDARLETLAKRQEHMRGWLVRLEEALMAKPSQKPTSKKRMKPLAKVARKTKTKARVKAAKKA